MDRAMRTLLALSLLAALLAGCASGPDTDGAVAEEPEDFTIDVTIKLGSRRAPAPLVQSRPGRFVVFADGSLHAGAVPPRSATDLPERRRIITRRDMARLWELVNERGLGPDSAEIVPTTGRLFTPAPEDLAYVVEMTGHDHRWAFIRVAGPGEEPDPAAVALIRHLAALSWESDLPPERVIVTPRRYDFGPDPYERFRRP
jgi:hypothetical protein